MPQTGVIWGARSDADLASQSNKILTPVLNEFVPPSRHFFCFCFENSTSLIHSSKLPQALSLAPLKLLVDLWVLQNQALSFSYGKWKFPRAFLFLFSIVLVTGVGFIILQFFVKFQKNIEQHAIGVDQATFKIK